MDNILVTVCAAKSIGMAGHIRPDGDCVGSCMALYNYLVDNSQAEVDLYLESLPESFKDLKNTDCIISKYDNEKEYDVFITLDSGSLDRLGPAEKYFQSAKSTINIDHHISNTFFAKENHVIPGASSTCEVLFDLFDEEKITLPIAEALYMGIVHDTGVFKHSNTTKKTMHMAGKLISKGVSFSKLIDESFYQKTFMQNQLLGRCLLESILILGGKCIFSIVTKRIMDFYNASPKDLDGTIDQLRVTKGVEVAILILEIEPQNYKVSMRSNGAVDVNKIASYFGGGGHVKAAGCTLDGNYHDVVNNLTKHIEAQLKEIESLADKS